MNGKFGVMISVYCTVKMSNNTLDTPYKQYWLTVNNYFSFPIKFWNSLLYMEAIK